MEVGEREEGEKGGIGGGFIDAAEEGVVTVIVVGEEVNV